MGPTQGPGRGPVPAAHARKPGLPGSLTEEGGAGPPRRLLAHIRVTSQGTVVPLSGRGRRETLATGLQSRHAHWGSGLHGEQPGGSAGPCGPRTTPWAADGLDEEDAAGGKRTSGERRVREDGPFSGAAPAPALTSSCRRASSCSRLSAASLCALSARRLLSCSCSCSRDRLSKLALMLLVLPVATEGRGGHISSDVRHHRPGQTVPQGVTNPVGTGQPWTDWEGAAPSGQLACPENHRAPVSTAQTDDTTSPTFGLFDPDVPVVSTTWGGTRLPEDTAGHATEWVSGHRA